MKMSVLPFSLLLLLGLVALTIPSEARRRVGPPLEKKPPHLERPVRPIKPPKTPPASSGSGHSIPLLEKKPPIALRPAPSLLPDPRNPPRQAGLHSNDNDESISLDSHHKPPTQKPKKPPHADSLPVDAHKPPASKPKPPPKKKPPTAGKDARTVKPPNGPPHRPPNSNHA